MFNHRSAKQIARDSSTSLDMTGPWEKRRLFDFVRRNLELVTIGIAEIDRLRDFVILEFEFDSALFQFALRGEKILPVSAKSEVKHSDLAAS